MGGIYDLISKVHKKKIFVRKVFIIVVVVAGDVRDGYYGGNAEVLAPSDSDDRGTPVRYRDIR